MFKSLEWVLYTNAHLDFTFIGCASKASENKFARGCTTERRFKKGFTNRFFGTKSQSSLSMGSLEPLTSYRAYLAVQSCKSSTRELFQLWNFSLQQNLERNMLLGQLVRKKGFVNILNSIRLKAPQNLSQINQENFVLNASYLVSQHKMKAGVNF